MSQSAKPPIPLGMVLTAIIGKAAERGLRAEQVEENMVRVFYDVPRQKKDVTNDSQAFRSIVDRAGQGQWRPRLQSLGESGYLVEVLPPKGRVTTQYAQVEPGPLTANTEVDLTDQEKLRELAHQLRGITEALGKIVGSLAVVVSLI